MALIMARASDSVLRHRLAIMADNNNVVFGAVFDFRAEFMCDSESITLCNHPSPVCIGVARQVPA